METTRLEPFNNNLVSYSENKINSPNPQKDLDKILGEIFPSNNEETKISKARSLLGPPGKDIPHPQLEAFIGQFEYLINCWLDYFEKRIFEGKTLREVTKSESL